MEGLVILGRKSTQELGKGGGGTASTIVPLWGCLKTRRPSETNVG